MLVSGAVPADQLRPTPPNPPAPTLAIFADDDPDERELEASAAARAVRYGCIAGRDTTEEEVRRTVAWCDGVPLKTRRVQAPAQGQERPTRRPGRGSVGPLRIGEIGLRFFGLPPAAHGSAQTPEPSPPDDHGSVTSSPGPGRRLVIPAARPGVTIEDLPRWSSPLVQDEARRTELSQGDE